MSVAIEVIAPSRLHFGLLSFGHRGTRQFGGAGLMIDQPGLRLRVSPHPEFVAVGPLAARARSVVEHSARAMNLRELPRCKVEITSAPREHQGLGTGTQLALSVVTAIQAVHAGPPLAPVELAMLAGRGARSAIGTYGFVQGGFLAERGKLDDQPLAPLELRLDVPAEWRFVLVQLAESPGLSGAEEREAFEGLPPVPTATTERLTALLFDELVPSIREADFARFAAGLYQYGYTAGMCFAGRQGGAFASPRIAQLVEMIRACEAEGVGQSSWGPTVFVAQPSAAAAVELVDALRPLLAYDDTVMIAEPNNTGARIVRSAAP